MSFLSQLVSEPTRGRNILDLVLVDNTDLIDEVVVSQSFSNSDHESIDILFFEQVYQSGKFSKENLFVFKRQLQRYERGISKR